MIRYDAQRRVFVLDDGYEIARENIEAAQAMLTAEMVAEYDAARVIGERKPFCESVQVAR